MAKSLIELFVQEDASVQKAIRDLQSIKKLQTEISKSGVKLTGAKDSKTIANETQKITNNYNKMNTAIKRVNKTSMEEKELQKDINRRKRLLIKLNKSQAGSYDQLSAKLSLAKLKWKQLSAEQRANTKIGRRLGNEIQMTTMKLKQLDASMGVHSRNVGNYKSALGGLGKMMRTGLGFLGVTAGVGLLSRGMISIVKVFSKFERTMSKVKAISGASSDEFIALKINAQNLGKSTEKTAAEVGQLQLELAKLGFSTNEILDATGAILNLSTAAGEDLGKSAQVTGSTLRAFGLSAKQTGRVTDVMAKAFSSSALDMEKFAVAMRQVAPVAKTAGLSLEKTTALTGVLANRGLDASQAGTALRNIFLELSKKGITWEKAMGKINNAADKNAVALDLFGKRGATAAIILAENAEEAENLTGVLERSAGATARMAAIMRDNLQGDADKAKSAMQGLAISIGEALAPALRGVTQLFTMVVSEIESWIALDPVTEIRAEQIEFNYLASRLKDVNTGQETRNRLVEQMQMMYPQFLKNKDIEKVTEEELDAAIAEVNKGYEKRIRLVTLQLKLEQKQAELERVLTTQENLRERAAKNLAKATAGATEDQKKQISGFQAWIVRTGGEVTTASIEWSRRLGFITKDTEKLLLKVFGKVEQAVSETFDPMAVNVQETIDEIQSEIDALTEQAEEPIIIPASDPGGEGEKATKEVIGRINRIDSALAQLRKQIGKTVGTDEEVIAENRRLQGIIDNLVELRKKLSGVAEEYENVEESAEEAGLTQLKYTKYTKEELDEYMKSDIEKLWEEQKDNVKLFADASIKEMERTLQKRGELLSKETEEQENNLKKQEERAKEGMVNTLAFEEKELAKKKAEQERQAAKENRMAKIKAWYNIVSNSKSMSDAFKKLAITEAAAALFEEGTTEGTVRDSLPNNGIFKGKSHKQGGIDINVEGNEGILSKAEMKNLGVTNFLRIKDLAGKKKIDNLFEHQIGLIPMNGKSSESSYKDVLQRLDSIEKAIVNKEEYRIDIDGFRNEINEVIRTGNRIVKNRYPLERKRL